METKWYHNGQTYCLLLGHFKDKDGDEFTATLNMQEMGPRRHPALITVYGKMNVAEREPDEGFINTYGKILVEYMFSKFEKDWQEDVLNEI